MSQKPPECIHCGSTDYVLESGYYFCSECQVQSQDIREEVFDEYYGGQKAGRISIAAPLSQEVATQDSSIQQSTTTGKSLTSWEVLNICLRGLVDELTLLGATKDLKIIVLQLWASYLMKTEAAFISKQIEKRPRLGLNFRKRDAEMVYGTKKDLLKVYKRPIYRKKHVKQSSKTSSGEESTYTNTRMEKYRLTIKKKKLAKAEYEQSSVSSRASEITLESLSGRSTSTTSQKIYRLRYTKKAKVVLSSLLDVAAEIEDDARSSLQKRVLFQDSKSVQHPSMSKVLAILRLALLITDSTIHLGDILRWSEEGYLSLLNAEKLLPNGISVGKDIMPMFVTTLNSRPFINRSVKEMADLLGVNISHRILPLIERYLKELQLPDDLLIIIRKLLVLCPPKLKLTTSVNYEGRAVAYILFVLKFLFGIDGATERRISKIAKVINSKQESDKKRLFNWSDWVCYINCRNSVLSVYHPAMRYHYHPNSAVGGSKSFLSHWDKIPKKHTLQRDYTMSSNAKDCIRRFLKDMSQKPDEPFPPSLSPQTSYLNELFSRSQTMPIKVKRILEQDFSNDSVEFIYNPDMQKEISEKYNIDFENEIVAKIVRVKPVVLEGSSVKPSLQGNKITQIIQIDHNAGKRKRCNRPYLNMKRGSYPDPDDYLQGKKLKERTESVNESGSLPIGGRGYWTYHGAFSNVRTQIGLFYDIAENVFPTNFLWVLKEASLVAHVCERDVYTQLTHVEKMYLEYITELRKPRKIFEDQW